MQVTIIPRGSSLGHTAYLPEREQYHVTRAQLQAMMDTMMGGRAAEELVFGIEKVTSGASSDLKVRASLHSLLLSVTLEVVQYSQFSGDSQHRGKPLPVRDPVSSTRFDRILGGVSNSPRN